MSRTYYIIKYTNGYHEDYYYDSNDLIKAICDLTNGYGMEQGIDFDVEEVTND